MCWVPFVKLKRGSSGGGDIGDAAAAVANDADIDFFILDLVLEEKSQTDKFYPSRIAQDFSCIAMHHFVEGDEGGDGRGNCSSSYSHYVK